MCVITSDPQWVSDSEAILLLEILLEKAESQVVEAQEAGDAPWAEVAEAAAASALPWLRATYRQLGDAALEATEAMYRLDRDSLPVWMRVLDEALRERRMRLVLIDCIDDLSPDEQRERLGEQALAELRLIHLDSLAVDESLPEEVRVWVKATHRRLGQVSLEAVKAMVAGDMV